MCHFACSNNISLSILLCLESETGCLYRWSSGLTHKHSFYITRRKTIVNKWSALSCWHIVANDDMASNENTIFLLFLWLQTVLPIPNYKLQAWKSIVVFIYRTITTCNYTRIISFTENHQPVIFTVSLFNERSVQILWRYTAKYK